MEVHLRGGPWCVTDWGYGNLIRGESNWLEVQTLPSSQCLDSLHPICPIRTKRSRRSRGPQHGYTGYLVGAPQSMSNSRLLQPVSGLDAGTSATTFFAPGKSGLGARLPFPNGLMPLLPRPVKVSPSAFGDPVGRLECTRRDPVGASGPVLLGSLLAATDPHRQTSVPAIGTARSSEHEGTRYGPCWPTGFIRCKEQIPL